MSISLKASELLHYQSFIDGKWCGADDGNQFDVIDPGSGKPWAEVPALGQEETERAINSAAATFPDYAQVTSRVRAQRLFEFDRLVRENKEDLAKIVTYETGKPYKEALGEVDYGLTFSWWFAGEAERIQGQTVKGAAMPNFRFFTIKQPIGPVALLLPWNFPVALAMRKICTALAAGCTFVAKPSPETPISILSLVHLLQKAGFEPGVVNVVTASLKTTPIVGKTVCESPKIKKVSFTGSTRVGKVLMAQSSSTLKKMTLELGGSGAFLVFADSDLERAADGLMLNKWRHAGQTCITACRTFVQASVMDKFSEILKQRIESTLKLGHGLDNNTTLGPVTVPQSIDRIEKHVQDARNRGAKIVTGGKKNDKLGGYFYEPTLVAGASNEFLIANEETFGPVLALFPFDTEEEVVEKANDTPMGLTNYVFTSDADRLWRMFEKLKAGNVGLNSGVTTSAEIPFGGWDESGYGKEGGIGSGIDEYLSVKSGTMALKQ